MSLVQDEWGKIVLIIAAIIVGIGMLIAFILTINYGERKESTKARDSGVFTLFLLVGFVFILIFILAPQEWFITFAITIGSVFFLFWMLDMFTGRISK